MKRIYLLVVGSRSFSDYDLMCAKLDMFLANYKSVTIVSGGAEGADTLAKRYASDRKYGFIEFPALWGDLGKRAGFIRNIVMHQFISQFPNRGCVAFWDGSSKGTAHSFELCKRFNNPLRVVRF
jgi:hypothetical protein